MTLATAAAARQALTAKAAALSVVLAQRPADGGRVPPGRAQRFAARAILARTDGPDPTVATLTALPDWTLWPHDKQRTLARLTAAAALAPALAQRLDGPSLRALAEAVGEARLDLLLPEATAGVAIPLPSPPSPDALAALGRAILIAAVPARAAPHPPPLLFHTAHPDAVTDIGHDQAVALVDRARPLIDLPGSEDDAP